MIVDVSAETFRGTDPRPDRAHGCLLGQLAGDSLGSLVEFKGPGEIRRLYPEGVRDLEDRGTWNILAGQPTDDSEMALALARTLVARGSYDADAAEAVYRDWLDSGPFDCGETIRRGLQGNPNPHSQANGALMRISPLGIFGARGLPLDTGLDPTRDDRGVGTTGLGTHAPKSCVPRREFSLHQGAGTCRRHASASPGVLARRRPGPRRAVART